jgi:hypothetical protein
MTLTPTPNQAARERAHHADHDVDRAEEGQRRHRGVRHVVAEERVAVEPNLVLEPVDLPVATASGMTHRSRGGGGEEQQWQQGRCCASWKLTK